MTTTEQYIGTGSLMLQGLRHGMGRGMTGSIAIEPNLTFVRYDPSGVLPSTSVSGICFDISTGSFLMCVGGLNSLDWIALQST